MTPVYDRVLAYIGDERADGFEDLALAVFAHQFAECAAYRRYCEARGRTPASVPDWRAVPAVPVVAFKSAELCCGPPVRTFLSSGTTEGAERRSRHSLPDLRLYHQGAVTTLRNYLFPDVARMRLVSLIPRVDDLPDSSLAQMVAWAMDAFGDADSVYAAGRGGLDADAFIAALETSAGGGRPICLMTTTAALMHAIDHCRSRNRAVRLPHGSRLMDTGGDKGAPRRLSRNGLLHAVWDAFAIPGYFCVNEYGMAELSSQYYDSVIADRFHGRHRPRRKLGPHWMRTLVLDPATLQPVDPGVHGLLCHVDLANAGSAMCVLSEDVGYADRDGLQLVGRAPHAETRGCSLIAAQWEAA